MKAQDPRTFQKTNISIIAFYAIFLLFLFPENSFSQAEAFFRNSTPPAPKVLKAADEAFAEKDYYSAMKYYEYVLEIEEEPTEVLFKYAEAARQFNAYSFAAKTYQKVLEKDSSNTFPEAKYHLAGMKKALGEFDESQILFEEFIAEGLCKDTEKIEVATKQATDCEWAAKIANQPDEAITLNTMGEDYNTTEADFGAIDFGNDLYYSSLSQERIEENITPLRKFSKILRSENGDEPAYVDFNDKEKQTANITFNFDKSRVYYTLCEYTGKVESKCKIYYRDIVGEEFKEAVALPDFINAAESTNTQPTIGYDKEIEKEMLYFVSDRKDGKGGFDIWVSVLEDSITFGEPYNLKNLNTEGNDITPFFHNESQTLFFSSDGRQTLGGYDVFQTTKIEEDWSEIKHLPAPINTSYNDTHYYLNEGETAGYVTSNRLGSMVLVPEYEACCSDLYAFDFGVIDLEAYTFNFKDEADLAGVTVDLFELLSDGALKKLDGIVNELGNDFVFPRLEKDKKYVLLAQKKDFVPLRDTIDLTNPELTKKRKLKRDLYLVPMRVDLDVFTFNKKSKRPLPGVEIRLVKDEEEIDFSLNEDGNDAHFVLERGNQYEVIGARVGFFSDTLYIDLPLESDVLVITDSLFLRQKEVEDFPPLMIFFDNDHPNPRTRLETTELTYEDTYHAYIAKKDLFVSEYTKVLEGRDSFLSVKRIDAFFEREVKNGYENLQVFSQSLFEILEEGYKVVLEIKGFTSPRAAEDYNKSLSKRRAHSLNNQLMSYNNGILKKYLESDLLSITEIPFGESTAPQFISDKMEDERGSIYSVSASFERKVEIVGVRIEQEK